MPFESTQNYSGGVKYLTGPEYFIDVALQRGDRSFKDFEKFTSNYKNFSKSYISDVEKRTKIFEVEESFIALCTMIGEDLETEAASFDKYLIRFAMLVKNAKTRKGMAKAFKSAYFGNMILGQGDDTARTEKKAGDPFIEQKSDTITKKQSRQRIVRYKANTLLRDFIINTLNVPSSKLKDARDYDHRNLGGNRYGQSIKQKEYAEKENIVWREDRSNASTKYLRNKIRHAIVPLLKELHPTFTENFQATQEYLRESKIIIDERIDKISKKVVQKVADGSFKIDIKKLQTAAHSKAYILSLHLIAIILQSVSFPPYPIVSIPLSNILPASVLSSSFLK